MKLNRGYGSVLFYFVARTTAFFDFQKQLSLKSLDGHGKKRQNDFAFLKNINSRNYFKSKQD